MQGQRDLATVSRLIMSEISPLVSAQHGAFFLSRHGPTTASEPELRLIASYGYQQRKSVSNRFKIGEALVGQAALEGKSILISDAPADYVKVTSGLGEATPVNIVVMPILFEEQVLAVVELASLHAFSDVNQAFLEQLGETLGVVLNAIIANRRTEELLEQSQSLAEELQSQSEELQSQQDELKRSNAELEQQTSSLRASEELLQTQQEELQQTNEELQEKAELLSRQNRDIEIQNAEIERARVDLEEKAAQLAVSSKYKSEFLANMSHELRTPLNSLLILSKLLAENPEQNLTDKQVEFASTIHTAGADLLSLISDILDLTKIEAGKMEINPGTTSLAGVREYVERAFASVAEQKGLEFEVRTSDAAPARSSPTSSACSRCCATCSPTRSSSPRPGAWSSCSTRRPADTPYELQRHRARHRHRHRRGQAAAHLRGLPAGRRHDEPALRRDRPGPVDQPRDHARARRRDPACRARPARAAASSCCWRPTARPSRRPSSRPAPPRRPRRGAPRSSRAALAARPGRRAPPEAGAPGPADDDRGRIAPGDRVALIVEDDPDASLRALVQAREHGFRAVVVAARQRRRDARARARARRDPARRAGHRRGGHPRPAQAPPAHAAHPRLRRRAPPSTASRRCARAPPASSSGRWSPTRWRAPSPTATTFLERPVRRLLIVEDDEAQRRSVAELVGAGDDVEVTAVGSSEEALEAMAGERFDCMVLDLKLPRTTGFALLDHLQADERHREVPVIVHTGKELTRREETRLRRYADSIIVKDAASPERLLDETALFLHRPETALPADSRRVLEQLHSHRRRPRRQARADRRRRRAQRLRADERARGARDGRALRRERPRRDRLARRRPRRRPRPDGRDDARARRPRDDARAARRPALRGAADHLADRQGDEGRPREVDRRRAPRTTSPSPSTSTSSSRSCGYGCTGDQRRPRGARAAGDRAAARGHPALLRLRLSRLRAGLAAPPAVAPRLRRGPGDDLRPAGAHPARPLLHGPAAARPVDQRHRDVSRPELSPGAAHARLPGAAHLSVHPGVERRLLDRRGDLLRGDRPARGGAARARADLRDGHRRGGPGARAVGHVCAGAHAALHRELPARRRPRVVLVVLQRRRRRRTLRSGAGRGNRLRSAQSGDGWIVQRVSAHRLPQRADLLRRRPAGEGARPLRREPVAPAGSSRWAARSRCATRATPRSTSRSSRPRRSSGGCA